MVQDEEFYKQAKIPIFLFNRKILFLEYIKYTGPAPVY